jgi:hypothetical protein
VTCWSLEWEAKKSALEEEREEWRPVQLLLKYQPQGSEEKQKKEAVFLCGQGQRSPCKAVSSVILAKSTMFWRFFEVVASVAAIFLEKCFFVLVFDDYWGCLVSFLFLGLNASRQQKEDDRSLMFPTECRELLPLLLLELELLLMLM